MAELDDDTQAWVEQHAGGTISSAQRTDMEVAASATMYDCARVMPTKKRRRSSATGCIDEVARVEDNGEPTPEERVLEES